MTSKYSIFHDEAFHDHKVTAKHKTHLNIESKDSSSYFYLMHLGFPNEKLDDYLHKYLNIESNYKKQLHLTDEQELKGTTIKKRWFKYGIQSMNEKQIDFYEDFLSLIDKDVLISVSVINQFELVFSIVFHDYIRHLLQRADFLQSYYAFCKFLYMNKTETLITLLFDIENNQSAIKQEIKQIAENVIKQNESIPHKYTETPTAKALLDFIINSEFNFYTIKDYNMDYEWSFEALNSLLNELNIPNNTCKIYIDGEQGFEHIIQMLQNEDFYSVEGVNSSKSTGTRMTDMFIRLVSAIIHSLEDQLINIGKNDKENKHDLSEEWFKLNEKQFNLYKTIATIFNQRINIPMTTSLSIYKDAPFIFFRLLDYIDRFESFSAFKNKSAIDHSYTFIGFSLTAFQYHLDNHLNDHLYCHSNQLPFID